MKGSLALIGEDTYLHNCMCVKHRCIHLGDVGAYSLREDWTDRPDVQFEIGRYYAEKRYSFGNVLLRSIGLARIHYLRGYVYQRSREESIPTPNPNTYPYSGSVAYRRTRQFWTQSVPMRANHIRTSVWCKSLCVHSVWYHNNGILSRAQDWRALRIEPRCRNYEAELR